MAICYDNNGYSYYCNSGWYDWGRWVVLGVILVVSLLFFFLCSLYSARRRRRMGLTPYRGTGWTSYPPWRHGQPQYNPNYNAQQPPPSYGQSGGYYGQNQGYFGGRQTETEMQPPQNVYQPPAGPPPGKAGDGIIR